MAGYALVGDVGGTNARLALCDLEKGTLSQIKSYLGRDYPSLESVIRDYLTQQTCEIEHACIAIASAINGDQIVMTNCSWTFSICDMQHNLGLRSLQVINDFTAVSMAIPVLSPQEKIQLGGGEPQRGKPIAVYGAGTGLGVSHMLQVGDEWLTFACEGGHIDFASNTSEEDAILHLLRAEWGHVSAERVLSGMGLENIYRALTKLDAASAETELLSAQQITTLALNGENARAERTLQLFCTLMGRFGGNLALTLGAFGGVYLAGGIVPRFLSFFTSSSFRQSFEDKGRLSDWIKPIPVYIITHPQPGLLGAGAVLRQSLGKKLQAS